MNISNYYVVDASKKSKAGLIIGVTAGVLVLLLLGCLILFMWRGRHRGYKREVFVDVAGSLSSQPYLFIKRIIFAF